MKYIKLVQWPKEKRKAICVCDTEDNIIYVVAHIDHNEDLFIQALVDSKNFTYVKGEDNDK